MVAIAFSKQVSNETRGFIPSCLLGKRTISKKSEIGTDDFVLDVMNHALKKLGKIVIRFFRLPFPLQVGQG